MLNLKDLIKAVELEHFYQNIYEKPDIQGLR